MAAKIAVERNLPPDWLNDNVKAYVPFEAGAGDWVEILREGDAALYVASADTLLAMKLKANRGRRDSSDIEGLLKICGVHSVEQAQELYERYHAQEVLSTTAIARIKNYLYGI